VAARPCVRLVCDATCDGPAFDPETGGVARLALAAHQEAARAHEDRNRFDGDRRCSLYSGHPHCSYPIPGRAAPRRPRVCGSFLGVATVRVSFLVDGFNLYHSLRQAEMKRGGGGYRWLDLRSLLASYLEHVDREAFLGEIVYFSALATHRQQTSPGTVQRHRTYVAALQATGVRIALGHFKRSRQVRPTCGARNDRHEEKETDVAIGATLVEWAATGSCDAAFLVSGDSDLMPAVRIARRIAPELRIGALFPFARTSDDLRNTVDQAFKIKARRYPRNQLPDPVIASSRVAIHRPPAW